MCEFDINGYMQNNTKFVFLSVETLSASRGFRYMYIIFKNFSENSAPGPLLVNGGREGKEERINRSWPPDKIPASHSNPIRQNSGYRPGSWFILQQKRQYIYY